MNLKQYIIDKSKELNIDIIGFTDCSPLLNMKDYLIKRKKENISTEFEEKDIERRIKPKLVFPKCKSIIVIGLSYNNTFDEKVDFKYKGLLSKSTWGLDYHIVVKDKMEKLIREVEKITEFEYKYFVDTGPLIDRELAKKANVGYYGKNCSIINDEYGSFIFIGYILTNLSLEISPISLEKDCGECQICIKSCPTGALEGPYKFNPRKCISYLTQTKNKIPYGLRNRMGSKIYGCDTCQLVCPKNKGIKKPSYEEFIPNITKGYMDIEELLLLSNKEFKKKYGSMAGSWRGKNILKRNGIIALGNIKDENSLNILEPCIYDPNPMIREYAAWAILNIDFKYGRKVVEKASKDEKDEKVKLEIENMIKYYLTKLSNYN